MFEPNEIAKLCFEKYSSLKKTGKPCDNEWTVLSAVLVRNGEGTADVVSLSTGTKCLGHLELKNTEIWEKGTRLSDSHAEVLARRAFLRYLYDQLEMLISCQQSNIFLLNANRKIKVKPHVSFHFFSSHTPCGDCSILPKYENVTNNPLTKRRKTDISTNEINSMDRDKTVPVESVIFHDLHRTGAKCIATKEKQDLYRPGINYHVVGPLRTKPGRGNPTLSLSCSDKMAKWNVIGVQGSLLSNFIPSIYFETVTIGGGCPFSLEAMERGIHKRFGEDTKGPKITQATLSFEHRKGLRRMQPCSTSIIWCATKEQQLEVAVEGRKHGTTKKKRGRGLCVSRKELLKTFIKLAEKYPSFSKYPTHPKKLTYFHFKQWNYSYQYMWKELRSNLFPTWPFKSLDLLDFTL
ncbi:tRNA-specific adenosine deaminase 1 [Orussus abietinus]|uniref:tRNA-specific adenosine deaminase 1 n=1 Tax=Orussus abietinus TaxID=222816 RepID=UPI000625BDCE|nr:tRNA-specific adenosine deaminase 1 [Orussus abietinus]